VTHRVQITTSRGARGTSLNLDFVPAGVSANSDDNINYKGLVTVPSLANDFSHPICKIAGKDEVSDISAKLPAVQKVPH